MLEAESFKNTSPHVIPQLEIIRNEPTLSYFNEFEIEITNFLLVKFPKVSFLMFKQNAQTILNALSN